MEFELRDGRIDRIRVMRIWWDRDGILQSGSYVVDTSRSYVRLRQRPHHDVCLYCLVLNFGLYFGLELLNKVRGENLIYTPVSYLIRNRTGLVCVCLISIACSEAVASGPILKKHALSSGAAEILLISSNLHVLFVFDVHLKDFFNHIFKSQDAQYSLAGNTSNSIRTRFKIMPSV